MNSPEVACSCSCSCSSPGSAKSPSPTFFQTKQVFAITRRPSVGSFSGFPVQAISNNGSNTFESITQRDSQIGMSRSNLIVTIVLAIVVFVCILIFILYYFFPYYSYYYFKVFKGGKAEVGGGVESPDVSEKSRRRK